MKTYIGVKTVQAVPVHMVNGCMWPSGLPLPEVGEMVSDKLGIAENIQEGYCFEGEHHYPEWMSKEKFENLYRPAENMGFGLALDAMIRGQRIARKGWNGKGMYVFLADDVEFRTEADIHELASLEDGVEVSRMLVLKTAQGTLQPGWLATQSDMLADDWYLVE